MKITTYNRFTPSKHWQRTEWNGRGDVIPAAWCWLWWWQTFRHWMQGMRIALDASEKPRKLLLTTSVCLSYNTLTKWNVALYRVTACNATYSIVEVFLSVHPSVRQTRALWQNKRKFSPHSYRHHHHHHHPRISSQLQVLKQNFRAAYTTWKIIHPSFLTRRMVGGDDPLFMKFFLNFAACTQRLTFIRCTELMVIWLCLWPVVLSMVCCLQYSLLCTKRLGQVFSWNSVN